MFKKITLKNGLRIIAVPQKSTQAVTVLVLVGTGSKYEPKEINGISHFLEHMFFKGTKKRPDKVEIAETLDKIGGIYNAFTSEDYTGYFAKVAASQFDLALEWVSDIYLNSLLPAKEIEMEKKVIIEEINMVYDNPMSHVGLLWNKLLYGDQPAGRFIAGTKETVSGITRSKLLDYHQKQYTAGNTVVCVAGNIKMESTINAVKKYFSSIKSGQPGYKTKVIEQQGEPECLVQYKETDQTHLCLGARGYNVFHPQKYAQDILGVILGGMMSSRLFIELREKLGLAYYIRTEAEANPDTGFVVSQAGVATDKVEKAITIILREYKKIASVLVNKDELKKTKENLKGRFSLMLEASDAQASFYGAHELLEKKILSPQEVFLEIDKVNEKDIFKISKDIFQPKNLNLAVIGPFKEKDQFEKLMSL